MKTNLDKLKITTKILVFTLVFFIGYLPAMGQHKKKLLTRSDYRLWHTVENVNISSEGKWITFCLKYENGNDTLIVKNVQNNTIMRFPKAEFGTFVNEESFVFKQGDLLNVMQLANRQISKLANISVFRVLPNQNILATLEKSQDGYSFVLRSLSNLQSQVKIHNVQSWLFSPENQSVALKIKEQKYSRISLVELYGAYLQQTAAESEKGEFRDMVWQADGKRIGFRSMLNGQLTEVHLYELSSKKQYSLELSQLSGGKYFSSHSLYLNSAGHVFVPTAIERKQQNADSVLIWNTNDIRLNPEIAKNGVPSKESLLRWIPEKNELVNIKGEDFWNPMLNGTDEYALLFDGTKDHILKSGRPAVDIYLHQIGTEKRTLLLSQFAGSVDQITASPGGKYFAVFHEGIWKLIECLSGTIKNLSGKTSIPFADNEGSYSGNLEPFEQAVWTKDDTSIIVSDAFDLFKVTVNGTVERLTHGRENNIKFRLRQADSKLPTYYYKRPEKVIDLSSPLLLNASAKNMDQSGFYILSPGKKEEKIYYQSQSVTVIKKSSHKNIYLIVEEDFDIPPRLKIIDENKQSKLLYESNTQQQNFNWGKAERIWFTNAKGERLPATLCYPAGYDPRQKYPMVVRIYQRQQGSLRRYTAPSLGVGSGINIANLTSQGYFVLLPDIVYEQGYPGNSALDCTLAAVKSAVKTVSVDESKIGLIGHSFGGYQSAYIATQTNVFATIVIGAGATDLVSSYLKIGQNANIPDFYRFESNQYRMKKGLYENFKLYTDNSPIFHAKAIETPLLSYSGAVDGQVPPEQGIELWLASLRLGKKHVMLLYPHENHILFDNQNKIDLCLKIEQWFGHYLKGEDYPNWARPEQDRDGK